MIRRALSIVEFEIKTSGFKKQNRPPVFLVLSTLGGSFVEFVGKTENFTKMGGARGGCHQLTRFKRGQARYTMTVYVVHATKPNTCHLHVDVQLASPQPLHPLREYSHHSECARGRLRQSATRREATARSRHKPQHPRHLYSPERVKHALINHTPRNSGGRTR